MARFHVFLGAPTAREIATSNADSEYEWRSVQAGLGPPENYTLPPATWEEASRRISKLYENTDFQDDSEEYVSEELPEIDNTERTGLPEKSTFITWAPTIDDTLGTEYSGSVAEGTFLRSAAISGRPLETQDTQETGSFSYSDASSIVRFPAFHFSLHILTSLSMLREREDYAKNLGHLFDPERDTFTNGKVNILAAVLEVEGPDSIRVKKGPDAGKEVSILKLIIGDDDGVICKLTAWREVADKWGGSYPTEDGIKRGDVVLLQNVKLDTSRTVTTSDALTLTASPMLASSVQICFRTMPLGGERDSRYRPDLRLGYSDATVRKVSAVVSWFENMAGLPHS